MNFQKGFGPVVRSPFSLNGGYSQNRKQVYYCKCCNLIGYSIRYLFLDRVFVQYVLCLISNSTKTIRLLAHDFYEVMGVRVRS